MDLMLGVDLTQNPRTKEITSRYLFSRGNKPKPNTKGKHQRPLITRYK